MNLKSFVSGLVEKDFDRVPSDLLNVFFEEKYSLRYLEVSARALQNWLEKGLLPYENVEGRKHHFNFVELIWLFIVQDLRKIGLPIKSIRTVKDHLMEDFLIEDMIHLMDPESAAMFISIYNPLTDEQQQDLLLWIKKKTKQEVNTALEDVIPVEVPRLTPMLMMLAELILAEQNFFILIDKEGNTEEFSSEERKEFLSMINNDSYIILPLSKYFSKFMSDMRHLPFLRTLGLINKHEMDMLEIINKGDAESVTIRFKNKQAHIIEIARKIKNVDMEKLMNIISKKGYLDISVKTQEGVISYTLVKYKKKV